jgi:dGTP triphosphohydrolase
MLPHRLKIVGVCYIMLLAVSFICRTQDANADDDINQIKKTIEDTLRSLGIPQSAESKNKQRYLTDAIQAFDETLSSNDEETEGLVKEWNDYIIRASHYSNTEYMNSIEMQLNDYYQAIADLGNIIEEYRNRSKKEYSSLWVNDLVSHFGIAFVKKNKAAILQSLLAISVSNEAIFENKLKELIYKEAMLYGSYREYLGMFLTFYEEELGQNDQNKIESRKKLAENFLALIDQVSLTSIYDTIVLKHFLSENKAKNLNHEVLSYLKGHPLSNTFGDSRALKDLMKVVGK